MSHLDHAFAEWHSWQIASCPGGISKGALGHGCLMTESFGYDMWHTFAIPCTREGCTWVGDDGNHCQNTVPLDSRINGVLCFQLFQNCPFACPPAQRFSLAAKQLFCFECRCNRCPPKVWASRLLNLLDVRRDQAKDVMIYSESHDSALLVHHWPNTAPYNVATAVCPDVAVSETERDRLAKKQN
jgi:hypothetical protein